MSKRTLDGFFAPKPSKKPKIEATNPQSDKATTLPPTDQSRHPTYPWPIPHLPPDLTTSLSILATTQGTPITDQPHLNLLYFRPFIPPPDANTLFHFLRSNLFFYRVSYTITRFGTPTQINTPRYTTVFGLDETSHFSPTTNPTSIIDNTTSYPVSTTKYACNPRPIPQPLSLLQHITEAATGATFNFCLVNYYATGSDSISFHSDDERFLGPEPTIASFSLGARRDFLMKHKPPKQGEPALAEETKLIKMPLGSGDMVLMRGETQANWLHSIPKRTAKGGEAEKGRINITFRRAMVREGTENYYRYNVGKGGVWKWDETRKEMVPWQGEVRNGG